MPDEDETNVIPFRYRTMRGTTFSRGILKNTNRESIERPNRTVGWSPPQLGAIMGALPVWEMVTTDSDDLVQYSASFQSQRSRSFGLPPLSGPREVFTLFVLNFYFENSLLREVEAFITVRMPLPVTVCQVVSPEQAFIIARSVCGIETQ